MEMCITHTLLIKLGWQVGFFEILGQPEDEKLVIHY
jgi:hypothetical protein